MMARGERKYSPTHSWLRQVSGQPHVPTTLPQEKGPPPQVPTEQEVALIGEYFWAFRNTDKPFGTVEVRSPDRPARSPITTVINRLTPNDDYSGRTAPLTSKRCILYIYQTHTSTEYFKHGIYSPFFPLQNAFCFINLTYFVLYYSYFI